MSQEVQHLKKKKKKSKLNSTSSMVGYAYLCAHFLGRVKLGWAQVYKSKSSESTDHEFELIASAGGP